VIIEKSGRITIMNPRPKWARDLAIGAFTHCRRTGAFAGPGNHQTNFRRKRIWQAGIGRKLIVRGNYEPCVKWALPP